MGWSANSIDTSVVGDVGFVSFGSVEITLLIKSCVTMLNAIGVGEVVGIGQSVTYTGSRTGISMLKIHAYFPFSVPVH